MDSALTEQRFERHFLHAYDGKAHKATNGFCTQIGNDWFTWFGTRSSKSRLNFLDLLRAGHSDYVLNDAAYGYMRKHAMSAPLIARLMAEPQTDFADEAGWLAHLERLGFTALDVTPNPVRVAALAAETFQVGADAARAERAASMRPRPLGRGNATESRSDPPADRASMRPRPLGRGNLDAIVAKLTAVLPLQ